MSEREPAKVAIVGAGPVGLCAALKLDALGVPCILLERSEQPPNDLRASTFHPPTLDMLDTLGLASAMVDGGLEVPHWQVRMHATHECARFDLSVLRDDTAHPFRLQFEQAAFVRLAIEKLAGTNGVDFRCGIKVDAIDQQDDSVRLQWPGGEVRAEYVIAADGASSRLRQLLDLPFEGLTYPETTILTTTRFPFEQHLPELSWVNYCWSDRGTFSLLRVPDRWRVSLYPEDSESVDDALQPARVAARLREIVPAAGDEPVLEIRPYRIHQRILDNYRVGRVLFAGDAAHLNSPSGGMGMNCGIHDAFNLAEKLARVLAGETDELLDLYDRQRRPIARDEILKRADGNRRRMQQRDPLWRRAELDRLQSIAADPNKAHEFLLGSSMIAGLRQAASVH
jgi:2-polyprenyl-6-methoxyphenol hydroxylase-like FAD-dependent oxidoreductase